MKRSRLSRGLQLQYWGIIIGVLVTVPMTMVIAAAWRADREASQVMVQILVLLPLVLQRILPLVGLILLWPIHRNYRLALLLTVLGWVLERLEGGQRFWVSAVLSVAVIALWTLRDGLFFQATNAFLRQAEVKGASVLGRWAFLTAVIQRGWSAVVTLLPPIRWMESADGIGGATPAILSVGTISGVLNLIYLVWASRALRQGKAGETDKGGRLL